MKAVFMGLVCVAGGVLILLGVVGLLATRVGPLAPPDAEGDAYRQASLKALWPLPCALHSHATQEQIDRAVAETARLREWAESIGDKKARRAYLGWAEYCEWTNVNAQKDLDARNRVDSVKPHLPVPPPRGQAPPPVEAETSANISAELGTYYP